MNFNLIFAVFALLALWAGPVAASPEIAVAKPTYDFGSITQGKKVEHQFVITNKGDSPLTIKSVRPSCGCTAVSTTTSVILPGKSGGIKASFNSANYAGTIHKTISVDTNDPKSPTTVLNLTGSVVEEIQINPKQLNVGQLRVNETSRSVIVITNMGSKRLKLTSVKSPLTQLAAVAEKKLLQPGESSKISVSIIPRSGDRLLSGYLAITTDNPARPEIQIPVYGSLTP